MPGATKSTEPGVASKYHQRWLLSKKKGKSKRTNQIPVKFWDKWKLEKKDKNLKDTQKLSWCLWRLGEIIKAPTLLLSLTPTPASLHEVEILISLVMFFFSSKLTEWLENSEHLINFCWMNNDSWYCARDTMFYTYSYWYKIQCLTALNRWGHCGIRGLNHLTRSWGYQMVKFKFQQTLATTWLWRSLYHLTSNLLHLFMVSGHIVRPR